jgi:ubiquinone/menaquinone biosynthesis C-methylase UbiE
MVRLAERKFHREIAEGRMCVQFGDVSHLPFPDAAFDRVFTINTIYFWSDVLQGLGEICRVLKNDCLAAISLRSKEKMQKAVFTNYGFQLFSPQEVAALMRQVGFRQIHIDHRDKGKLIDSVIVIGFR